jgi:hypothetical protein
MKWTSLWSSEDGWVLMFVGFTTGALLVALFNVVFLFTVPKSQLDRVLSRYGIEERMPSDELGLYLWLKRYCREQRN